ncbi:protein ligase HEL2 [Seminavis robusta]|uniref:Protein ligase HEL2 n=1 Tax=Seminavis robusta TaxID=568900 RepID=A0A9N8DIL9_9STRA|nr:protein ligase HEL2 [Seminavis robusta]|eukprot:Sro103_g052490.1 protein ligase HEL2 (897) ;mRNA; r:50813-53503
MSTTETTADEEPSATAPSVPLTELDPHESVGDQQHCLVCYSELHHPGISPCNHNEICGVCHLRLRHLHGNRKCPICKEEHDKIIVDTPGKTFDEYPMWGDELGGNYIYRENVGMFFEHSHYHAEIQPLFGYQCTQQNCPYDGTVPDNEEEAAEEVDAEGNKQQQQQKKKPKKPATPLRSLQDHLRVKHRLALCTLCIDNKRDFVARLPRMAPHQLKKHLTKGDPGTGFGGHPICEFCRPKRFYDLTHLHLHLQKDHYKCHVCEKQGMQNQFFRNYQNLEKHFGKAHFICQDVQCLQARFVVFENEIDLHAHERQVHGGTTTGSSKIQLEFRTRRTGYDGSGVEQARQEVPTEEDFNFGLQGEAFVPAALPRNDGPTLHPLHLQRTAEFRAHAAQIREQQELENQGVSFPTLQAATGGDGSAAAGQQPLNIGWTSSSTVQRVAPRNKNAGAVTETDFPALPSSAGPKSTGVRAGAVASNRQFAAMRGAAHQPVPAAGGWGTRAQPVAAAPHSYQHNSAAFPPVAMAPAHRNRAENLTQDNFPALGGGSKKPAKYTAAGNLSNKYNKQPAPSWNSAVDFPAPATSNAAARPAARPVVSAHVPKKAPPSLNSQTDFPPPPGASNKNNSVKNRVIGNKKQPTQAARANVLQMPQSTLAPANPQDTLNDMQASLGPAKYKKLKKLTRDFATGDLEPDSYVDQAAALFEQGYGDPDFWKTFPALVSSCPSDSSVNEALRYMESLRTRYSKAPPAPAPRLTSAPRPAASSWNAAPPDLTPESFPTMSPASTGRAPAAASGWGGGPSLAAVSSARPAGTRYVVANGKKKGAWGAGAAPTSVTQTNKKTVASVATAAANEGPQGGTATKFMAKQNKQQNQQQQPQGKKKNKKKEKDELRNLAFGK